MPNGIYFLESDSFTITAATQYDVSFSGGVNFAPVAVPPGLAIPAINKDSGVRISAYRAVIVGIAGARTSDLFEHNAEIGVYPSPSLSATNTLQLGEYEEWIDCDLVYPTENPDLMALTPRFIRLVPGGGGTIRINLDVTNLDPVFVGRDCVLCLHLQVQHAGFVEGA